MTSKVTQLVPGDRVRLSRVGGWYEVLAAPKFGEDGRVILKVRNQRTGAVVEHEFPKSADVYGRLKAGG